MLDYSNTPCPCCGNMTLVYMQHVADSHCETCDTWEQDYLEQEQEESAT